MGDIKTKLFKVVVSLSFTSACTVCVYEVRHEVKIVLTGFPFIVSYFLLGFRVNWLFDGTFVSDYSSEIEWNLHQVVGSASSTTPASPSSSATSSTSPFIAFTLFFRRHFAI